MVVTILEHKIQKHLLAVKHWNWTTVAIQKGDLAKKEEYNGTLRQTDSKVLNSPMSGVVTYVPKEGTIINFGEVLFAVDNKPVILVEGACLLYTSPSPRD